MAVTWKKLAYEDDVVLKTTLDAHQVMITISEHTPIGLDMTPSTMLARLASGNIVAATPAEIRDLLQLDEYGSVPDHTLDAHDPAIGNVDINGYQLLDQVLHTVANDSGKSGLGPIAGKIAFQTDTLSAYICTAAA